MKREYIFHLMAAVGCVAIIGLGLELFVRFVIDDGMQFDLEMWKYARDVKVISSNPLIGHRHAPNRRAHLMGVDVHTNSKGQRDREFSYERTPGTLRIVMLGDSVTEGWGVSMEDTFSKRVERMFVDAGVKAEVINTGVGNYNTIMEVEGFLTEDYRFNPDIVVINYFINDAEPVPKYHQVTPMRRICYSCVFLTGRIDILMRQLSQRGTWVDYYRDLYDDGRSTGWLAAKAAIRRLSAYCRENGIKLLIAHLPELHDVQNYPFQSITDLVRLSAAENGVEFIDLLPNFKGTSSEKLWVTVPDPHPNSLAHQLIAEGLFAKLQAMRWIARSLH
jgi:lysophospholipase L1-like esterase